MKVEFFILFMSLLSNHVRLGNCCTLVVVAVGFICKMCIAFHSEMAVFIRGVACLSTTCERKTTSRKPFCRVIFNLFKFF